MISIKRFKQFLITGWAKLQDTTKSGLMLVIIGFIISIFSSVIYYFSKGILDIDFSGLLFLFGIILIVAGRKEFGKKHSIFVLIAAVLFVINLIISIFLIGSIYIAADNINSIQDFNVIRNLIILIPLVAILDAVNSSLFVFKLEDRRGKFILLLAFVVTIIISIYIAIELEKLIEDFIYEFGNEINNMTIFSFNNTDQILNNFMERLSALIAITIIKDALFLIAFAIPYYRIKSGKLTPELPDHLKKCIKCSRVCPSDSIVCPYCGHEFSDF